MNFDEPSLPSCIIPIVGVEAIGNGLDPNFAFERGIGIIQYCIYRVSCIAIASQMIG